MKDRFPVSLQRLWHPRLLCLPLLHRMQIFEGHPSLPRTDGRIATAVPAPFKVVQTPSLSWLPLHLSAHPLGTFLLAASSLPRVTSELAALTPLCVLQTFFGGLACALETHEERILQCVVMHDFAVIKRFHVSRMPRMSFCCVQQNAPNQRLPQPDFGAESDGTWSLQSTKISRLGLDGRAPLRLHLTPEVLNNCGGSNCFAPKCELVCSTDNFCTDAKCARSCSSNQDLQLAVFTRSLPDSSTCDIISANLESWLILQKIKRLTKSSTQQRSDRSNLLFTVFPRENHRNESLTLKSFFWACVMLRAYRRMKHNGPWTLPCRTPIVTWTLATNIPKLFRMM